MSCKSCGASKVERNKCAYCGNPTTTIKRNIQYIDVSDMSYRDTKKLLKSYEGALEGQLVTIPNSYKGSLQDMIWYLN